MIFSIFRRKKKQKEKDVPSKYQFAVCCKECGTVIWGDEREGRFWRVCEECKGGKNDDREKSEL